MSSDCRIVTTEAKRVIESQLRYYWTQGHNCRNPRGILRALNHLVTRIHISVAIFGGFCNTTMEYSDPRSTIDVDIPYFQRGSKVARKHKRAMLPPSRAWRLDSFSSVIIMLGSRKQVRHCCNFD